MAKLDWNTVINGKKKIATTHFGTQYTLTKLGEGVQDWAAYVTVPKTGSIGGGTEILVQNTTFAAARKVVTDDYKINGGR